MTTQVDSLKQKISLLEQQIIEARKAQDWDHVNYLIDCIYIIEEELDKINEAVRYQEDLQSISDFYDDEKNRDAYTMMIIDKEFSDVAS